MCFVALTVETSRSSGYIIKLLVPHTIMNQRHIATTARSYTDSSFMNGEIPLKLTLAFAKMSVLWDHG